MYKILTQSLCILGVFLFLPAALAQEGAAVSENEVANVEEIMLLPSEPESPPVNNAVINKNSEINKLPLMQQVMRRIELRRANVLPSEIQSNFFTSEELELLRQARAGLITSLTDSESGEDEPTLTLEAPERPPGPRNIRLGGLVYLSKSDWALWLNEEEVRPNAIPSAILDLRVNKNYIELEWYDTQTNQIYPIRLRPNQTFNLDARLFLPG